MSLQIAIRRSPNPGRPPLSPLVSPLSPLQYRLRRALISGRSTGAEAVLQLPQRRSTAPGRPAGRERRGAGLLTRACADAALWPDGTVSIPLNAKHLQPEHVASALAESGLDPERLELLFAETALTDPDEDLLLALAAIRDLGVGLAVDEFAAELGNLSHLRRLPMTALKLSRNLVRGLPADRCESAIARAIVATAQALEFNVIADGIDTESQLAFLAACGCDEGQGPLFGLHLPESRPMGT